jgi:type VI secretion system protein ImpK
MTPKFARQVDPVFSYVIGLLDRIEKDERLEPREEHDQIKARISSAGVAMGDSPDWQLAKYALVSWIDEVLIDTPWSGRDWWINNTLEWEEFRTNECAEQFFVRAKDAASLSRRDALEVYYVCVVLGFRGLYRDETHASAMAGPLGLPDTLEQWTSQVSRGLQLQQGRPPIDPGTEPVEGAPPLFGRDLFVKSSVTGLILLVFAAIAAYFWLPFPAS